MPADATPDLAAIAAALAAKHGGDASKALEKLVDENHDLRAKNRTLRDDLKAAQDAAEKGKTPEGAVVLTGKAKEAHEAYLALGTPDELKAKLDAGDAAAKRLAEHEADALITTAADAAGYKVSVLKRLAGTEGLTLSVKTETVDGEQKPVAYAVKGDGAPVKLTDYVSEHLAEFAPALAVDAGTAAKGAAASGAKVPPSGPARAGGAPKNAVDAMLEANAARAKAPNALRPAKAS